MINIRTVRKIEAHEKRTREFLKEKGKNWLSAEESKQIDREMGYGVTNEMRSNVEVYRFMKEKPKKYFLYIGHAEREATTWTGQKLGRVLMGHAYHSNFGDIRIPIDVIGINGVKYHGTYFKSAGDYARITAYRNQ